MKIRNKDLLCYAAVGIFLIAIYAIMKKNPATIEDRTPPAPINQYTSGAANGNGMDVNSRVNFRQQPTGSNFS